MRWIIVLLILAELCGASAFPLESGTRPKRGRLSSHSSANHTPSLPLSDSGSEKTFSAQLTSPRFTLRPVSSADFTQLKKMLQDPRVSEMSGDTFTDDEIRDLIRSSGRDFSVLRYDGSVTLGIFDENQLVGAIAVSAYDAPVRQFGVEIGYTIAPEYWGRGIATEVTKRLVEKAFTDLSADAIYAKALKKNVASQKVLRNAGLTETFEGKYRYFSLTRANYQSDLRHDCPILLGDVVDRQDAP